MKHITSLVRYFLFSGSSVVEHLLHSVYAGQNSIGNLAAYWFDALKHSSGKHFCFSTEKLHYKIVLSMQSYRLDGNCLQLQKKRLHR